MQLSGSLLSKYKFGKARGSSPVWGCPQGLFPSKDQEDWDIDEDRQDEDYDEDCAEDAGKDNIIDVTSLDDINLSTLLRSVNIFSRRLYFRFYLIKVWCLWWLREGFRSGLGNLERHLQCRRLTRMWRLHAPNLLSFPHTVPLSNSLALLCKAGPSVSLKMSYFSFPPSQNIYGTVLTHIRLPLMSFNKKWFTRYRWDGDLNLKS